MDLFGDRLAVGASLEAYLYRWSGGLAFQAETMFREAVTGGFGESVALGANYLLCGDRLATGGAGRVTAFSLSSAKRSSIWRTEPAPRSWG